MMYLSTPYDCIFVLAVNYNKTGEKREKRFPLPWEAMVTHPATWISCRQSNPDLLSKNHINILHIGHAMMSDNCNSSESHGREAK